MQFTFARKGFRQVWQWYTLFFLVYALAYFGVFFLTGHTLIWRNDAATQHLQILQQFHKDFWYWMHHLSSGPSLWTWHMGLGSDILEVYSYYVVGDIFSYPALFVPYSWIPTVFCVMIVIRLYCAGLAFSYMAHHFRLSPQAIVAGTVTYMASGFMFYATVAQPFFMNPTIQFPLLLLATGYYLKTNKKLPLTLMFFWVFINNFYFAYLLGIGYGLFLLIYLVFHHDQWQELWVKFSKIVGLAIVGALLAAVVLVPAIVGIRGSVRSSDSVFANGIWHYNYAYYFQLPVRLISLGGGGTYWTSLIFVAPVVIAACFIWKRWRQYPLLAVSLGLTVLFTLIPAVAAIFNGFSSPYNRWLLLAFVPVALAVAALIDNLATLTPQEYRFINITLLVYMVILFILNVLLFTVSLVALALMGCSWGLLVYAHGQHQRNHTARAKHQAARIKWLFACFVLINGSINAIMNNIPQTYGLAISMLTPGQYTRNTSRAFAGLDRKLKHVKQYRVATLANNYMGAGGVTLDNTLDNRMQNISSFYSVITKSYGTFAQAIGNSQYMPIKPLRQVDNRSILENFLGVKYIFVQTKNSGHKAIPATFKRVATSKNGKTALYRSNSNFSLLWWNNKTLTQKQANALTQTQREYMLLQGVVVPSKKVAATTKTATLPHSAVRTLKYHVVDANGKRVSLKKLQVNKYKKQAVYHIVLDNAKKYRNSEIHVDVQKISYQPMTTRAEVAAALNTSSVPKGTFAMLLQAITAQIDPNASPTTQKVATNDTLLSKLVEVRNIITEAGQTNSGYTLTFSSDKKTGAVRQPAATILPAYYKLKRTVVNLGYYKKTLPNVLSVRFKKNGTYRIKVRIYAVNLGKKYRKAVRRNQRNALHHIKKTHNGVTATLNHKTSGVVTSTIPYSQGWRATVDGKAVAVYSTNYGFVGFTVGAGKHTVKLTYHSPGLYVGLVLSCLGVMAFAGIVFVERRKRR